jgi:flagellar protein FlgJ
MIDQNVASSFALDSSALNGLKNQARAAPDKALRQAASQFEAVFMNMLLKSMRDTLQQDGPLDSRQTKMYTGMLDEQMAQKLSVRGIGLADLMVKQLSRQVGKGKEAIEPGALSKVEQALSDARAAQAIGKAGVVSKLDASNNTAATGNGAATSGGTQKAGATQGIDSPQDFVDKMLPQARAAEQATGVPAQFILGQAALESGWGKHEIRGSNGEASHNLFGVKAGKGWTGDTVDVVTTEYVDGKAHKVVQTFRAYDSYADAFADWAKLIGNNPRYAKVLEAGKTSAAQFAQGLQKAGYATDPLYAAKLTSVINNQLLKQAFA